MSIRDRIRRAIENGPPGWMWAGALTTSVMIQEFRGELSMQFAMYAGGLITAWLGYRGWKNRNGKEAKYGRNG